VKSCKAAIVAALSAYAATFVYAQSPEQTLAEQPGLIRDAFASDYGKAMVAELGKSLRTGADPECLKSQAIAPDQLEARGRDIVIKWGTRMMEGIASIVDPKVYAEKFAGTAGPDAATELERLKQDAAVKRYLTLVQPMRLAKVIDSIFEQFERYVLISKIKLAAVFPLATGNAKLLSRSPIEATEKKLDKLFATAKSAALDRYLELSEQASAATKAAMKKDKIPPLGPLAFFKGVETDLAEICIGAKQ
jgi:hypothetical protein